MGKSLDGLHPTLMRPRVEALLADPEAKALGIYVVSAFRSIERQRELFAAAVKKYGSEAAARKWVAPPGKSNHGPKVDGFGTAVDLGIPGYRAVKGQWPPAIETKVHNLAAKHGLFFPMPWEDWHAEPIKSWKPLPLLDEGLNIMDDTTRAYFDTQFAAFSGRLIVIEQEIAILRNAVKGTNSTGGKSALWLKLESLTGAVIDAVKK